MCIRCSLTYREEGELWGSLFFLNLGLPLSPGPWLRLHACPPGHLPSRWPFGPPTRSPLPATFTLLPHCLHGLIRGGSALTLAIYWPAVLWDFSDTITGHGAGICLGSLNSWWMPEGEGDTVGTMEQIQAAHPEAPASGPAQSRPAGDNTKQHRSGDFNAHAGFGLSRGDPGRPPRGEYHLP